MALSVFKTAYLFLALFSLPQVFAGPGCARRNYGKPDCVEKCKSRWGVGGHYMGHNKWGSVMGSFKDQDIDLDTLLSFACGLNTTTTPGSAPGPIDSPPSSPTKPPGDGPTPPTPTSPKPPTNKDKDPLPTDKDKIPPPPPPSPSPPTDKDKNPPPADNRPPPPSPSPPTNEGNNTAPSPVPNKDNDPAPSPVPNKDNDPAPSPVPNKDNDPAPSPTPNKDSDPAPSPAPNKDNTKSNITSANSVSTNPISNEALTGHNSFRALHGASPLTWNEDLATAAKKWVTKCKFEHSGGQVGAFGENLAAGTGGYTVTDAINGWTAESKDYDPKNPVYSHFTQVVWKSTKELGCAIVTCNPGTIFPSNYGSSQFVACEYNPPGNYIGEFGENVQA